MLIYHKNRRMVKMSRCRLVLAVWILGFCAVSSATEDRNLQWFVSAEALADNNLERVWQNRLAVRKTEKLERLFILGNRIYGLSDSNYIVSMNRETGAPIFSRPIAEAGLPVLGFGLYEKDVFFIAGNRLIEINSELDTEHSSRRLEFNATCPAARNKSYFYIVEGGKHVHVLRATDKVRIFTVGIENNSMITSVVAGEDFFVLGTDAGNIVSYEADGMKQLWRFKADGSIVEPIVKDGKWLFFAGKDTNVYKINVVTGRLVWKYPAGVMLDEQPRVTQEIVYQHIRNKGLAAINKKNGKLLWQLDEGTDLLAEENGMAYVITKAGTLIVMDNKKARQVRSVNLEGVSKYAVNVTDSRIYIASEDGRIVCLKSKE